MVPVESYPLLRKNLENHRALLFQFRITILGKVYNGGTELRTHPMPSFLPWRAARRRRRRAEIIIASSLDGIMLSAHEGAGLDMIRYNTQRNIGLMILF